MVSGFYPTLTWIFPILWFAHFRFPILLYPALAVLNPRFTTISLMYFLTRLPRAIFLLCFFLFAVIFISISPLSLALSPLVLNPLLLILSLSPLPVLSLSLPLIHTLIHVLIHALVYVRVLPF